MHKYKFEILQNPNFIISHEPFGSFKYVSAKCKVQNLIIKGCLTSVTKAIRFNATLYFALSRILYRKKKIPTV
jgi:hypothetical protein